MTEQELIVIGEATREFCDKIRRKMNRKGIVGYSDNGRGNTQIKVKGKMFEQDLTELIDTAKALCTKIREKTGALGYIICEDNGEGDTWISCGGMREKGKVLHASDDYQPPFIYRRYIEYNAYEKGEE
jgi:hypothetical protein